jgi:peroxiredoxin 2/4
MKKSIVLLGILILSVNGLWSQKKSQSSIPLIGSDAPSFIAQSTNGQIAFPGDYVGKWKILFSHPRDYTPVCSSELLELAQKQKDFDKLGVKIVILSTDTLYQHFSWKKTLDTLRYKDRTPEVIHFPLIDDNTKYISKLYGMLHEPTSSTRDVRGVYIIDTKNKIRAIFFYPSEVGRNLNEIERTVIALQTSDKESVLTPANWKPGDDVLIPYVENNAIKDPRVYQIAPFMIAKKLK